MGEGTRDTPKCLTSLGGRTLLAWQLQALTASGVAPVALVTGYRAERLRSGPYETFHNARWAETNMVASLLSARAWLRRDTCIVSYADIVVHPTGVQRLMQTPGECVVAYDRRWRELWSARFVDPLSDAESFQIWPDGRLRTIGERARSLHEVHGQYMGLLKITREGWGTLERFLGALSTAEVDRMDTTTLLRRCLQGGATVDTAAIDGRWCEVDSAADVALYEHEIAERATWSHDWRP
jgi:choline kinase